MDIQYMQQMIKNPSLEGFTNRGLTEEQILYLGQKYNDNKLFPKAFREFLKIAGDFNNVAFDDWGEGWEAMQEYFYDDIKDVNKNVERPIVVFSIGDVDYLFI